MKSFWTRAYRKNIEKMIGVCYRYVLDRSTAEDLAHDAFLTAIEKADSFRRFGSFEGWLMRITINKALLYLREEERTHPLNDDIAMMDTDAPEDDESSPEDMMAAIRKADFSQEEILDAIAQLPAHHRTVLNLYVFERLTHQQIAELLDISQNTSKSHLMRARKELQTILFKKSKEKKHLLMILLPLYVHPDAAIDGYCRSKLSHFAIAPLQPLREDAFPTTYKVSPKLWMYAHKVPFLAGVAATGTTVTTAGILLLLSPQDNTIKQPEIAESQSVTIAEDTVAEMDTGTVAPYESLERHTAVALPTPSSSAPTTLEEPISVDVPTSMLEPSQPVVVKRIRRTNRTIMIQDSAK